MCKTGGNFRCQIQFQILGFRPRPPLYGGFPLIPYIKLGAWPQSLSALVCPFKSRIGHIPATCLFKFAHHQFMTALVDSLTHHCRLFSISSFFLLYCHLAALLVADGATDVKKRSNDSSNNVKIYNVFIRPIIWTLVKTLKRDKKIKKRNNVENTWLVLIINSTALQNLNAHTELYATYYINRSIYRLSTLSHKAVVPC